MLLVGVACAWPQPIVIPVTPAGQTLKAWLDAFNSGDRTHIEAYAAKYEPTQNVDRTVAFRDQTGGFDLLGIDKSDRLHIEFPSRHDRVRHEHKDRCRHAGARD